MPQMEEEYMEKHVLFPFCTCRFLMEFQAALSLLMKNFLSFLFVLQLFVVSLLCNAENSKFYEMIN